MPTVTWKEASLCPKCETQGVEVKTIPIPYRVGARGHIMICPNIERCNWGKEKIRWIIQVNPNGTIPVQQPGPKQYPDLPKITEEDLERRLKDIEDAPLQGGEVNNPFTQGNL